MPLRSWVLLGAAISALAGTSAVVCGTFVTSAPGGAGLPPAPGIVLLCVDTLRADAVGTPAAPRGLMPSLERFGREGATFTDAVAPSSWTAPSVTSALTGRLPSHHGLRTPADQVPEAVETLASRLRAAGWATTASTAGSWVSPSMGTLRGFDRVDLAFDQAPPEAAIGRWNARRRAGAPFLLFLHTFAAHSPYGDKSFQWGRDVPSTPEARELAERLLAHAQRTEGDLPPDLRQAFLLAHLADPLGHRAAHEALGEAAYTRYWRDSARWCVGGWREGPDGGAAVAARLRGAYEGGLGFPDEVVGRALNALAVCALPPGTVVVVFGDHGEALGEAGTLYHGLTLEESVVRVPLLVRAPGRISPGTVARGTCGLVDLMPTLLAWAGLPAPDGLDGVPLDAVIAGGAGRPVVAELDRSARALDGPPVLVAVRDGATKWVASVDPARGAVVEERLYDLEADPLERAPLAPGALEGRGRAFGDEVQRARARWLGSSRSAAGAPPPSAAPAGD